MSPRIGALFAGYGGLELASRIVWPDADLAWVSEFDAAPSSILAHHWPTVPNLGDVTRIDWSAVEPVDVITGGSPCQDLSAAGKRAGMTAGTRSNLWESMREGIAVLRPSLVIWENVRGALSARAASDVEREPGRLGNGQRRPALRALGRVLGDLASLGYDAAWTGLRAADVGAPHGRWRVFVVAWPQGDGSALTWPQGDGSALTWPQGDGSALTWPQGDGSALLPTPAVNDMGEGKTLAWWDEWAPRQMSSGGRPAPHGTTLAIEALRMLPTPSANVGENGGSQHPDKRREGGHQPTIADVVEHLLPTPRATRGGSGTETMYSLGGERSYDDRTQGRVLLPTPRATDGTKGGPNQRGSSGDLMLPSAVHLLPDTTGTHGTTLTDALVRNPRRKDADQPAAKPGQDLPGLRDDVQPEALQGGSREQPALPLEGLLLAELREHADVRDEGRAALAGAEAPSGDVRRVRDDRPVARASQRPEPREQRPSELDDTLRVLSPAPALAGGPGATDGGCREGYSDSASAWGTYALAVARWEMVLGRPAPAPTEPTGRDGAHRLSARAVEWMQGLPDGWVTDVPGITRNHALKALGNGVVPQQAGAAIPWLLDVMARESRAAA